jgi:hypothetical protein
MIIWSSKVRFKESQKNSGEFGLVYKPGSNTDILVMFVTSFLVQTQQLKTSSVIFYGINGTQLTVITNLYWQMIALLNLADYNAGNNTNNKTVALTKTVLAENDF